MFHDDLIWSDDAILNDDGYRTDHEESDAEFEALVDAANEILI